MDVRDETIDEVRRVREAGESIREAKNRVDALAHAIAERCHWRDGIRVLRAVLGSEGNPHVDGAGRKEPDPNGDAVDVVAAGVVAVLRGEVSAELAAKVDVALSEIGE